MADGRVQGTAAPLADHLGVHLLLYDGMCGLCSRVLQFVLEHDRRGVFSFAALQGETGRTMVGRWGGNPDELTTFYVCAHYRTASPRVLARSDAALFIAREMGWPWKAFAAARVMPKVLRDAVYDLVARTRYRLFGRFDRCLVPRPEVRRRFID
jgi:predicted DCC family thiol-disulfide oxidoreductase YuxK